MGTQWLDCQVSRLRRRTLFPLNFLQHVYADNGIVCRSLVNPRIALRLAAFQSEPRPLLLPSPRSAVQFLPERYCDEICLLP